MLKLKTQCVTINNEFTKLKDNAKCENNLNNNNDKGKLEVNMSENELLRKLNDEIKDKNNILKTIVQKQYDEKSEI